MHVHVHVCKINNCRVYYKENGAQAVWMFPLKLRGKRETVFGNLDEVYEFHKRCVLLLYFSQRVISFFMIFIPVFFLQELEKYNDFS